MSLIVPVGPEDHVLGPADAPFTLVEYGDYQCPFCGRAYLVVKEVQRRIGGGRLRVVFRNLPLNEIHPLAEVAAEAAEAAGGQGKFWQMHDALYENQRSLGNPLFARLARLLSLDVTRFARELREGIYRPRVRRDFLGGVRSGAAGTPTFFVNDERFDGDWTDPEELITAILTQGAELPRVD